MLKLTKKEAQEIVQKTIDNGGYTHNSNGMQFVVGKGIEEKVLDNLTENDILEYVETANRYNSSFGTWYNAENGKFYLDLSDLFNCKDEAMRKAKERNEIAFYDLLENKEILVKETVQATIQ